MLEMAKNLFYIAMGFRAFCLMEELLMLKYNPTYKNRKTCTDLNLLADVTWVISALIWVGMSSNAQAGILPIVASFFVLMFDQIRSWRKK